DPENSFGALRLKNYQQIKKDIGRNTWPNSKTQMWEYQSNYYLPMLISYFAYQVIGDLDPIEKTNTGYKWFKSAMQLGNYLTYSPDASVGAIDPVVDPTQTNDHNKTWITAGDFLITYLPTWDEFNGLSEGLPDQPYYSYSLFNATPTVLDTDNRYYRSCAAQGAIYNTIGILAYDLWYWLEYFDEKDFPEGIWEEINDNYVHILENLRIAIAQVHTTQIDESWLKYDENGNVINYPFLTKDDIGGWLSGSEDYVSSREQNDGKEIWKESPKDPYFTRKAGTFATLNALESILFAMDFFFDRPRARESPIWGILLLGVIFLGIIGVIVYLFREKPKFVRETKVDTNTTYL
ncbi:MAG: hypothetical protein ACFFCQ_13290, partial [Promethearchaeota archaeon]